MEHLTIDVEPQTHQIHLQPRSLLPAPVPKGAISTSDLLVLLKFYKRCKATNCGFLITIIASMRHSGKVAGGQIPQIHRGDDVGEVRSALIMKVYLKLNIM